MSVKSISPELYLYYSLSIEPFDSWSVSYKKSIDLAEVCKNYSVMKNQEVKKYFKEMGMFCPMAMEKFIETCYVEYVKDEHKVKIFFYKILNSELLTANYIVKSSNKNVLTCIHRTINLQNNLLSDYDKYFNAELDNIISTMEKPRYYNLSNIYVNDPEGKIYGKYLTNYPIEEVLKIHPYDYQKDNINWMIELEKNPIQEYIGSDKLLFFPDGRIYNYQESSFITNEQRELVTLKGGVILDNVGIGKTFQLLCLAMHDTSINTIIVVPDHLAKHWAAQFVKHFNIGLPNFITIVKYSEYSKQKLNKYSRLIVDEIHELYSNNSYRNILELMYNTGCKYKWGISATPFPVPNSIYHLLRFLTEKEIHYSNIDRYSYFYDTYYKIFRRNTLENIVNEIKLPEMTEHNLILEFNDQERILYDSEIQANKDCDIYFLRKCCCDVLINFNNGTQVQILSLNDFNKLVLGNYMHKFEMELEKYNTFVNFYNNCIETLEKIDNRHNMDITQEEIDEINEILKKTSRKELINNINHYKFKIEEQKEIVANRKQAYEYLHNKINDTNKECPVCMGEITDGDRYDVPECGHICCSECMNYWLYSNSSCTVCKKQINRQKMYTITNLNQVKLKYSTKIDKLLEIIVSNPNDKFIIYTQFDNMIEKLIQTLNCEGIGCIQFEEPTQIEQFQNDLSKRVLILSSVKNASGIDLSFVSNIIMFEPIIGDTLYLMDIEKQIIGRIYRIGQTKNINVYRFIIKYTIEEDIFKKARSVLLKH